MKITTELNWGNFSHITQGRVRETRMQARQHVGNILRNLVHDRVNKGMGAYGKLAGYSRKPFYFSPGKTDSLKPMLIPPGIGAGQGRFGGSGKYYKEGYAEYIQEVTGQSTLFKLKNTGDLWRDWRFFPVTSVNAPLMLGFLKAENTKVAEYTEQKRPGIFVFKQEDIDFAMKELVQFLSTTWFGSEYSRYKRNFRV